MKKLLSLVLSLAMSCTLVPLVLPAAAASSVDQRLAQVTAKVKRTLTIGDQYSSFYGEPNDNGVTSYWSLSWSGEGCSLSIEADENAKIMRYSLHSSDNAFSSSSNLPSFPKTKRAEAQQTADAFLNRVLASGETAVFDAENSRSRANTEQHQFSGEIYLNGLPSPIHFSLTVRAADNQVTYFYRSDLHNGYLGGIPSASPVAERMAAIQSLKGTIPLRLEYVQEKEDGQAVLWYLPDSDDQYYVDAQTGTLVNLTQVYEDLAKKGQALYRGDTLDNSAAPMAMAEMGGGLSQAEQEGISKLEGVLPKETLDWKLRAVEGLNLSGESLSSSQYWVDRETNEVFARLSYVEKSGSKDAANTESVPRRHTVVVDARTAEIQSLSSRISYDEKRTASITEEQAEEKAKVFLSRLWGTQFALTERYAKETDLPSGFYTFTYAQKVNGYFFPENQFKVSVNVEDGSICGLEWNFEDGITFADTENLISADAALDIWFGSYTTTLGYLSVPEELNPNDPQAKALLDQGERYYYSLCLSFYLDRSESYRGVDAKTGALTAPPSSDKEGIVYSDLLGCWAKTQIETLASYGIGYSGGMFQPSKELTQIDWVALLTSTQGYSYDPSKEGAADDLYRYAYSMGLLTAAQRKDETVLTRIEAVRLLLDGAGYGETARLKGIFRCSFQDQNEIPADDYGYAAVAEGMGILTGDDAGYCYPNHTATRLEAAVMLYHFMGR